MNAIVNCFLSALLVRPSSAVSENDPSGGQTDTSAHLRSAKNDRVAPVSSCFACMTMTLCMHLFPSLQHLIGLKPSSTFTQVHTPQ